MEAEAYNLQVQQLHVGEWHQLNAGICHQGHSQSWAGPPFALVPAAVDPGPDPVIGLAGHRSGGEAGMWRMLCTSGRGTKWIWRSRTGSLPLLSKWWRPRSGRLLWWPGQWRPQRMTAECWTPSWPWQSPFVLPAAQVLVLPAPCQPPSAQTQMQQCLQWPGPPAPAHAPGPPPPGPTSVTHPSSMRPQSRTCLQWDQHCAWGLLALVAERGASCTARAAAALTPRQAPAGLSTACAPMVVWAEVGVLGTCPWPPPPRYHTPLPPTLGRHPEHTVHSMHGEEGALLVVGGVIGGGALWVRREGGTGSMFVEGNKVLSRKLSTVSMVLGVHGGAGACGQSPR
ncbi:uncharacterized protein LOC102381092 isoform X1 [Alligator sinensis]|uniref:Uncharacterized protein LOC102381092 isoform X1 n=1 Tax=Alligator sinensis TaxID=38654 RepID=A0A3Q0HN01_ALLSI|nr:uncharacterized protein LOC102381092 isoform X1 [Alligator sinensis]